MGPPAAGATTGTPDASASCTAWQKVSSTPVCAKMSNDAYNWESCSPLAKPVKCAVGINFCSFSRHGPSPTMTTDTPGKAATSANLSTCFSRASLPTNPTTTF